MGNVGSNQLHEIRKNLRGKAVIYCGKNTQIRRVLRKLEEEGRPELECIRQKLKLNIALVFTNDSLADLKDLIEENKMPAAARAGALAQCDVVIEKGVTALEPSQTSFLQALNIGTKITKGQIEIINDVHLLHKDVKVDASQAALLQKLGMQPVVSVPYTVLLAFKNLLAVSVATDFDFKGSEKVKAYLKDPSAFA